MSDFARDGYVVIRGLVPSEEIDVIRSRIDREIAADESIGALPRYAASSFCPRLRNDPDLTAAFRHLAPAAHRLLGVDVPATFVQIALRYPEHRTAAEHRFHIDGFPAANNGVDPGSIYRHTLLAGIFLSTVDRDDAGGLMLWPGSHRRLATAIAALDPKRFLDDGNLADLMTKIEAIDLGEPQQLHVEPGDAVLVHHLVAHAGAPNLRLQVRYALYCRLQHPDHDPADPRSLVDPDRWFTWFEQD